MAIHITVLNQAQNQSVPQKISVSLDDLPKNANAAHIFGLPEINARPLCTGMGKCGRCKIRYLNNVPDLVPLETILLTKEEQEQNIRLACKHPLQDNTEFAVFNDLQEEAANLDIKISVPPEAISENPVQAVLFVDLGTTSVAFEAKTVNGEQSLAEGKLLNPQMFAGADVMARLYYRHFIEKKTTSRLQTVILNLLKKICSTLKENRILPEKIYLACNPSMTAIFLGESAKGLMEAPYHLENKGNKEYCFQELPPVYIPSQISAFVGADAAAGLAHVLMSYPEKENFLLADLGTNGEFIFYNQGKLFAASIPLGPALEGVGMRCGSVVHGKGENIILNFSLTPFGLSYICNGQPLYICGAAYLSLINILLSAGILDRQGLFPTEPQNLPKTPSPLYKKLIANLKEINGEKRFYVSDNLYVCAEDIENIVKVKASFSSAVELFLQKNPIENIFLSGALSSHIPVEILENLGFLPRHSKQKTKILGNSSLLGLISLNQNPALRDTLAKLAEQALVVDLTSQSEYNSLYINNMHF